MTKTKTNANLDEITEQLEQGVREVFESDRYAEYLSFMGRFHDYSVNNCIMIMMQKPDATMVAGYQAWKTKFNRQVRKGEKGIRILAPCPHKKTIIEKDGTGAESLKEVRWTTFRTTTVFDVSQTEGDEVPEIVHTLTGQVEGYAGILQKLEGLAPVPVEYEQIQGSANGFFSDAEKKIVIQDGMSEQQTVKTLIHEIAHSKLHGGDAGKDTDRHTKEVQAESVAYTVCQVIGIDTSDYSFGYVAGWSKGKEVKELTASMEVIRRAANEIIDGLRVA